MTPTQKILLVASTLVLFDSTFSKIFIGDDGVRFDIDIEKVFGNMSKAFYVDDVGYDIVDAENVVRLFYESVAQRRLSGERRKVTSSSAAASTSASSSTMDEIVVHLNSNSSQEVNPFCRI